MPAGIPVAFWLLPAGADAAELQARIVELSQDNGTVSFDAHVTLHVDTCSRDADIESLLRNVAAATPPLTLVAGRTHRSAAYFKALYVDLDAAPGCVAADATPAAAPLPALRRRLAAQLLRAGADAAEAAGAVSAPVDLEQVLARYTFLPHLSLLYGDLPPARARRLAERNDMHGRRILFGGIAAVRPSAGHADLSKVAHWEVFGHRRLGR